MHERIGMAAAQLLIERLQPDDVLGVSLGPHGAGACRRRCPR